MSSTGHQSNTPSTDWMGIVRTLLVQVSVLVVLAAAVVWYLNWSSDAAWSEFIGETKPSLSSQSHQPQSLLAPVQTVKEQDGLRQKNLSQKT